MAKKRMSARWKPWLWSVALWLGFGVIDGLDTLVVMRAEGMHHPWLRLFLMRALTWLPWALMTPAILKLAERYTLTRWKSVGFWVAHGACGVGIGAMFSAWGVGLDHWLNPFERKPAEFDAWHLAWRGRFIDGIISYCVLYGVVLAVNAVLESRATLQREETEKAQLAEALASAQLDALRRQIEPHFLFNTLNAVSALVREQRTDDAVQVIAGLSEFLRRVLEDGGKQVVPLGEEMEFAERYLEIQKVRFAERLRVSVDVPAETLSARVPTLMVQMMVENAIKHGIAQRAQGGEIRVCARREDGALELRVGNDGPMLQEGWERGSGIGLANLRTRLQSLYGERFELRLANAELGVDVTVRVPFVG